MCAFSYLFATFPRTLASALLGGIHSGVNHNNVAQIHLHRAFCLCVFGSALLIRREHHLRISAKKLQKMKMKSIIEVAGKRNYMYLYMANNSSLGCLRRTDCASTSSPQILLTSCAFVRCAILAGIILISCTKIALIRQ